MTILEWQKRFDTVEDCHTFLVGQRWPQVLCARAVRIEKRGPFIAKTWTVLHRSKVPLPVWFLATYLVAIEKRGVAALTLARQLGVAYATAWPLHHKIQRAMTVAFTRRWSASWVIGVEFCALGILTMAFGHVVQAPWPYERASILVVIL